MCAENSAMNTMCRLSGDSLSSKAGMEFKILNPGVHCVRPRAYISNELIMCVENSAMNTMCRLRGGVSLLSQAAWQLEY
jgi:hypothetical protein